MHSALSVERLVVCRCNGTFKEIVVNLYLKKHYIAKSFQKLSKPSKKKPEKISLLIIFQIYLLWISIVNRKASSSQKKNLSFSLGRNGLTSLKKQNDIKRSENRLLILTEKYFKLIKLIKVVTCWRWHPTFGPDVNDSQSLQSILPSYIFFSHRNPLFSLSLSIHFFFTLSLSQGTEKQLFSVGSVRAASIDRMLTQNTQWTQIVESFENYLNKMGQPSPNWCLSTLIILIFPSLRLIVQWKS